MDNQPQSDRSKIIVFILALVIYAAFAVYLYINHLNNFYPYRRLLIPAAMLAASGTYILSTRWLSSPIASFFAGLLYAFGPFTLGFALYHPAAQMLVAILPFLLIPAALWPHKPSLASAFITTVFAVMPFVAIIAFFTAAAHYGFFPVPLYQKLHFVPYVGLLTPLVLKPMNFPFPSFYHFAVAPFIFGLFLFIRLHRFGAILFCAAGFVLAFYASISQTSPIIWAALPMLCFSIVAGLGLQGLVIATDADSVSLANCSVLMAVFAAASALVGFKLNNSLLFLASFWYIFAALAVYLILRLATSDRRARFFRWTILGIPLAVDIFISARAVIDKLF
jgi:hypothetical protein